MQRMACIRLADFNPLQRKAGDLGNKTGIVIHNEISIHSSAKPETNRYVSVDYGTQFQSTPAQSRRRQFYPNNHIINHHFLYKTSNFTLTSPNPITKTNHKPFFYQCESLHIFMFTYLSHYPVLFYYNTLPSIIPETFSPIPTPKDTLHKNIFDIPRPGILLLVPGL
mgnify:CR=1 FL=1